MDSTAWVYASYEFCKRTQIFPNTLAYNESTATLCIIVKRSSRGDEYALSKGGLDYALEKQENGALKDGSPVRHAIVVLGNVGMPVKQWSAEEMRDRLNGIEPHPGKWGPYWWIKASDDDDGRF